MNNNNHDDLLWRLADHCDETGEPQPGDADLEAYRRGELAADERRRMEALLARNPVARQRLMELAGVTAGSPPVGLRARILAHAPTLWRPRRVLMAGAGLAASLLLAIAVLQLLPGGLPDDLHFDVVAAGLAEARGATNEAETVFAYPHTEVRIDVNPRGPAHSGIEFGLYRVHADQICLLATGSQIQYMQHRGTARFVACAADLVGSAPGTRDLLVVAANKGDLPDTTRLEPDQDPATVLAAGDRRRVYRQPITVLAEDAFVAD